MSVCNLLRKQTMSNEQFMKIKDTLNLYTKHIGLTKTIIAALQKNNFIMQQTKN